MSGCESGRLYEFAILIGGSVYLYACGCAFVLGLKMLCPV